MKYMGEELVRVTSHDELRVGMMVVVAPCRMHRKPCAEVLTRTVPSGGVHGVSWAEAEPCHAPCGWIGTHDDRAACFCDPIADGRLYRLQEPPAEVNDYDVQETPTKAKERTR